MQQSDQGGKYMIGKERRKTIIVSKLMYRCGALAWYQRDCDDLEEIQNGFGRCYGKYERYGMS